MKVVEKMKKTKKSNMQILRVCISLIIVISLALLTEYEVRKSENLVSNSINSAEENLISKYEAVNINADFSNIPEYSGEIVINLNNNIPYFTNTELTEEEFEVYSNLDDLGRCGVAIANICKNVMPPEDTKRGNISYKPSGWVQYLYGENNSKHLYERCHLIAWQLGNENNNKKNLITGTSSMNAAMIPFENEIANWIKSKNKEGKDYHVLYRVTPIYEGDNLLATGVEIEAKSVEEEGILFNKFIYNIEEGFRLNYLTGESEEIL